jgi:hypothetical protein
VIKEVIIPIGKHWGRGYDKDRTGQAARQLYFTDCTLTGKSDAFYSQSDCPIAPENEFQTQNYTVLDVRQQRACLLLSRDLAGRQSPDKSRIYFFDAAE